MSKGFVNISLAIKQSLRFENETQYNSYQMNNSIKNKIYSKISHNTSLWTDCKYGGLSMALKAMLLVSCNMRNKQICKNINISRRSVSLHIIREENFESKLEWHT